MARKMQRPALNTALVLEQPERVADGGGGFTISWTVVGTIWADMRSVSARENVAGVREASRVTHRITLRAAPVGSPRRPTSDCRFRQGERIFAIRGLAPADQRNAYLTCWAEEGPFA